MDDFDHNAAHLYRYDEYLTQSLSIYPPANKKKIEGKGGKEKRNKTQQKLINDNKSKSYTR